MSRRARAHEWHRPRASRRAFLEIVPEGEPFRIFGVHLSAVHSNWTEQRRVRELRALLEAPVKGHSHPEIDILFVDDLVAVDLRVKNGKLSQRFVHSFKNERHERELGIGAFVELVTILFTKLAIRVMSIS